MGAERRRLSRRNFSYYMTVVDQRSGKLIGHLSDISVNGFKVDASQAIPLNEDFRLSMDQIGEISKKKSLTFTARSMWCGLDPFDPNMYNVGFKIIEITPDDHEIFLKMFEKYGTHRRP